MLCVNNAAAAVTTRRCARIVGRNRAAVYDQWQPYASVGHQRAITTQ